MFSHQIFNPCAKGSIDKSYLIHNINATIYLNKKTAMQIILKDKKDISLNIFSFPFKKYMNKVAFEFR